MKTIKVSEATGPALDWMVARCEVGDDFIGEIDDPHFYSTDWAQGGPIIERECVAVMPFDDSGVNGEWGARDELAGTHEWVYAPTPLIAAMRCYVASKLGDEVEVPAELLS